MFEICPKDLCTGCSACANICPRNAIFMKQDEEGFLRPNISLEQCVLCGKCKQTCPINNSCSYDSNEPIALSMQNNDEKVRKDSSSGGIFSVIAEDILSHNGVVVGAAFDDNWNVVHQIIEKKKICKNFERANMFKAIVLRLLSRLK